MLKAGRGTACMVTEATDKYGRETKMTVHEGR